MDKKKLLDWIAAQPAEHRLTCRQILDTFVRTKRAGTASCTLFLSPEEARCAESVRAHFPSVRAEFYPEDAERRVLCLQAGTGDPADCFDAQILQIEGKEELTHRHILGAAMATGITRDRIGDIRTDGQRAELMVKNSVAGFLADTLTQIGRQNVRIAATGETEFTLGERPGELLRIIVSSTRLDAVVAALAREARNKAQERIKKGFVKRNHTVCTDAKRNLDVSDVLSIRGLGRFRIESEEGTTKKGNCVFTVSHTK